MRSAIWLVTACSDEAAKWSKFEFRFFFVNNSCEIGTINVQNMHTWCCCCFFLSSHFLFISIETWKSSASMFHEKLAHTTVLMNKKKALLTVGLTYTLTHFHSSTQNLYGRWGEGVYEKARVSISHSLKLHIFFIFTKTSTSAQLPRVALQTILIINN